VSPSDGELVARVQASDDRAAFGQLVVRHQSAVRRFLRHLARGNHAIADDLAQETFLHAYRQLHGFRGAADFSTWLLGIAHNHWRNAWRRIRRETPLDEAGMAEPAAAPAVHQSDLRQDLDTALRQLSAEEQLALHLGFQQGLSHGEIAALLDWPVGTVKTHLARGKEKLRHLLAAWNPQT
jgi:RNA polymerase sigma-70 factor (ECF subfamily)